MNVTTNEQYVAKRPQALAALLLSYAAALVIPGCELLLKGGSCYYAVAGLLSAVVSTLLWRRSSNANWLYAVLMAGTVAWAVLEAGADSWALAPRLIMPAGFGMWIALSNLGCNRNAAPRVSRHVVGAYANLIASISAFALIAAVAVWPHRLSIGAFPPVVPDQVNLNTFATPASGEWRQYGGTLSGTRYSRLAQINTRNVGQLRPAWTYQTGIVQKGEKSGMEATPLLVNNLLYFCTQTNVVIALDPDTGMQRWRFDPKVDPTGASLVVTCRGVAYFEAPDAPNCPRRIITSTFNAQLLALNADTGALCASFGERGTVDLKKGLGDVDPGFYYVSSAPTIVNGNVILGGWIADNVSVGEPSGVVRAYDALTGRFAWAWDLGRPGQHAEPGPGQSYTRGTPNSWAPMSGDEALGMVYLPTGNATPDHWAGHRSSLSDQFSSSVVALDARTGELRWSFQTVHHDTWDYDVPAQPTLIDLTIDGVKVPALVQTTKQGATYLIDRRDGKPLSPVEERPVPHYAPPGDYHTPTQPYSPNMPSFAGRDLQESDMWGLTPFDQLWCRLEFRSVRYDGQYTPIMVQERSLIYPGIGGGVNWGGISIDPERGVMYANSLHVGTVAKLLPRAVADAMQSANSGKNVFHSLSAPLPQAGTPFAVLMNTFVSPLGVPCNKPPFGEMTAFDLNSRKTLWTVPLGGANDSGPWGMRSHLPLTIGTPNFGGSIATRGGLVFIGATHERAIRAFDAATGKILWKAQLPAAAQATPMTYLSPRSGRQFVVTIASGHRTLGAPLGDYVQAFALPAE